MAGCEYNPDPFGTGLLMEHLSHQASLQNKVFRSMIKEKEGGDVPCGFC